MGTRNTTQVSLTHFQLLAFLSIQDGRLATPGSALKLKPVSLQSAALYQIISTYIGTHSQMVENLHPDRAAEAGLALPGSDLVVEPCALEVVAGPDGTAAGELEIKEFARGSVRVC